MEHKAKKEGPDPLSFFYQPLPEDRNSWMSTPFQRSRRVKHSINNSDGTTEPKNPTVSGENPEKTPNPPSDEQLCVIL